MVQGGRFGILNGTSLSVTSCTWYEVSRNPAEMLEKIFEEKRDCKNDNKDELYGRPSLQSVRRWRIVQNES